MTLGSGWASEPPAPKLRHHTRLAINLKQLENDEGFPKGVLAELKALSEIPDLALLLRQYASAMARIHGDVRDSFLEAQERWMNMLAEATSGWGISNNKDDMDLGLIVAEISDGELIAEFDIYGRLAERVVDLQRRNFCMTALDRAYFTSEVVEKK